MARKSSSVFYLRDLVETDGTTFVSSDIDISSFVNTLQGDVLRVNQVWFEWSSNNGDPISVADVGVDHSTAAMAQLTTESQTGIQPISNTSLLAKHQIYCSTDNQSGTNNMIMFHEDRAMNPADFRDGFLVASDNIQFGIKSATGDAAFSADIRCCVILECEQVKMSAKDAQAILLSQALG